MRITVRIYLHFHAHFYIFYVAKLKYHAHLFFPMRTKTTDFHVRLTQEQINKLAAFLKQFGEYETISSQFRMFIDSLGKSAEEKSSPSTNQVIPSSPQRTQKPSIEIKDHSIWITCPKNGKAHKMTKCLECTDPQFQHCRKEVNAYMLK